jgi:hypothetical protein
MLSDELEDIIHVAVLLSLNIRQYTHIGLLVFSFFDRKIF